MFFCLFHAVNPFWEKLYQNPVQFFSVIPHGVPLSHRNALQYYVKREKCKVNDVIFPSGCEARAINLGKKNMKIGVFTSGTSVRSKNIFTAISLYPTGKREINEFYFLNYDQFSCYKPWSNCHDALRPENGVSLTSTILRDVIEEEASPTCYNALIRDTDNHSAIIRTGRKGSF